MVVWSREEEALATALMQTSAPASTNEGQSTNDNEIEGAATITRIARPPSDHPHNNASTANLTFENDTRVSGEVVFDIDETVAKALKMRSDDDEEDEDDEEDYQKAYFVFGEGYDPIELTSVLKEASDQDIEEERVTASNEGGTDSQVGGSSTPTPGVTPSGDEDVAVMQVSGDEKSSHATDRLRASIQQLGKPSSPITGRYLVIQTLNRALMKALPFIDLTAPIVAVTTTSTTTTILVNNTNGTSLGTSPSPSSFASTNVASASATSLLSACRGLIFEAVKLSDWEEALAETESSGGQFELKISRSRAKKHQNSGQPDHTGRFMVFSQVMGKPVMVVVVGCGGFCCCCCLLW